MQSTLIKASAGSGKTTRFIQMLHAQLKSGVTYDQVQILMFSKNASVDFKDRIKAFNTRIPKSQCIKVKFVNVNTIHSLAYYIIKEIRGRGTQQESQLFVELLVISALDLLRNQPVQVLALPKIKNLRFLYVDEAQDLNSTEYLFITQLQQALNAKVCMVGDPKQNIYQMKQADASLFLNHPYEQTETLPNNYRSNQQLLNLAHVIARGTDSSYIDQVCTRGDSTDKPSLYWGSHQFLLKRMCHIARRALEQRKSVGVIGPVKTGKAYLHNLGLQSVRQQLKSSKINYYVHFKVDNDSDAQVNKKEVRQSSVNLLTIHQSKGLEFDVVIFIDPQHALMNSKPLASDEKPQLNLMYVAVTRAKNELHMFLDQHQHPHKAFAKPLEDGLLVPYIQCESIPCQFLKQPTLSYVFCDGDMRLATEEDLFTARSNDIIQSSPILAIDILPFHVLKKQQTFRDRGKASLIHTWDLKQHKADQIKDNVHEVMGFYIQQGIQGDVPGVAVEELDTGVQFPEHLMFFDQGFALSQFKAQHGRNPLEQERLRIDTLQQELSELATIAGCVFEDLLKYCVNSQQPQAEEATQLIQQSFDKHLKGFVSDYQAYYLLKTAATYWNQIQSQISEMYDVYCKLRESPVIEVIRGQSMDALQHIDYGINGTADIANDHYVVELKYAKQFRSVHYCQLLMYSILLGSPSKQSADPKHTYNGRLPILFNIRTGQMQKISVTSDFMAGFVGKLLQFTQTRNHTIAYDFETTGLDPYTCDVIEYCFYDVNSRVPLYHSLVKPKAPVSQFITQLTGITNDALRSAPSVDKFQSDLRDLVAKQKFACLVAHNGRTFDQVILSRYAGQLGVQMDGLNFQDSIPIVRLFGNGNESVSLSSIYQSVFGCAIPNAHSARGDCEALARLLHHYNIVAPLSRPQIFQS